MKLSTQAVDHLKSVFAHNVAQISSFNKASLKEYLETVEDTLTKQHIPEEQVFEIVFYAKRKGRVESKILKEIYERHGITPNVAGFGGSSISIETLVEIAATRFK